MFATVAQIEALEQAQAPDAAAMNIVSLALAEGSKADAGVVLELLRQAGRPSSFWGECLALADRRASLRAAAEKLEERETAARAAQDEYRAMCSKHADARRAAAETIRALDAEERSALARVRGLDSALAESRRAVAELQHDPIPPSLRQAQAAAEAPRLAAELSASLKLTQTLQQRVKSLRERVASLDADCAVYEPKQLGRAVNRGYALPNPHLQHADHARLRTELDTARAALAAAEAELIAAKDAYDKLSTAHIAAVRVAGG